MFKSFIKITFQLSVLGLLIGACGSNVPPSFRGQFVDARTGSKLELSSDSGTFTDSTGRVVKADKKQLDFEDLQKGKAGIYMRQNPVNKNLLELYWVQPNLATKEEAGGMEWFHAEVLYFRMDIRTEEKVDLITSVHSLEGVVTLDIPTKLWQIGWPAGSEVFEFKRVAKK